MKTRLAAVALAALGFAGLSAGAALAHGHIIGTDSCGLYATDPGYDHGAAENRGPGTYRKPADENSHWASCGAEEAVDGELDERLP